MFLRVYVYTCVYIYIFIYIYVCVDACVCLVWLCEIVGMTADKDVMQGVQVHVWPGQTGFWCFRLLPAVRVSALLCPINIGHVGEETQGLTGQAVNFYNRPGCCFQEFIDT